MDLSTIKNVSPNKKIIKKILAVAFSVTVIVVSYIVLNNANEAAKDTIEVLRVTEDGGLPAYVLVNEKMVKKYAIIRREYTEDMILAEDLPEVIDQYTKYFIRDNSILYKDQLMSEKPLQNEWLYELDEEREVLTLPYNFLEAGGDILMPGDRVRIRISFETDDAGSAGTANPKFGGASSSGGKVHTEVLFDSIEIRDMLNSNSHSIYEVYKEVLKLSEDKRQEAMKSQEFLKSIQPKSLLLEGTREQINKYAALNAIEGKKYLITILSRMNSQVILDELPTLQREVESWIESKN